MRDLFRAPSRAAASVCLQALLVLCVMPAPATGAQDTPRILNKNVQPTWLAADAVLWISERPAGATRTMIVRAPSEGTAEPREAFDHAIAARLLTGSLSRRIDPDRLPITKWIREGDRAAAHIKGADLALILDAKGALTIEPLKNLDAFRAQETDASRSSNGGAATEAVFRNETAGPVTLDWLDFSGSERRYATIPAGDEHTQNTFAGHVWRARSQEGAVLGTWSAQAGGSIILITPRTKEQAAPPETPQKPRPANVSPDGKWAVQLSASTVTLRNTESGVAFTLANDGAPSDSYEGPVRWSPTSTHFVVTQRIPGSNREVTIVESSPDDQLQPRVRTFRYRKPGDAIDKPRPRLFSVESKSRIDVAEDLFDNPWSISRTRWAEDGDAFTFVYNQRGHTEMRLVSVDAQTGVTSAIIDEKPTTFFDYAGKLFLQHIPGANQAIWMSERDGWNHLYLIDTKSGDVIRQLTSGNWLVRSVERIDPEQRTILIRAMGVYEQQDPYHVHFARVDIDTAEITWLTQSDGTHRIDFNDDRTLYTARYSRVDLPPVTELRRTADGSLVCAMESADATEFLSEGIRFPERFNAKGRDGTTDIWGIIHHPADFDPDASYPIIESIYAGPHGHHVPKSFIERHGAQRVADLGYIVVQIDGMGTNWRSKAFHDVAWKNLGDSGFPDRIPWIKAAASTRPYMDTSRVGIFGVSAGGQSAMRAVTVPEFSDFYKAAVADCGCHDNRMDKIWWNELWMSWPIGPHYQEQANVTNAKRLEGELLLLVGEIDQNVDPASTMQVADALIKAGKQFELVVMPGVGHGTIGTPFGRAKMDAFFKRTLQNAGPPASPES